MSSQVITTIVTPATSYDLVDFQELKEDLQITSTTDDGYIKRTISRASAAVAQYCNRVFVVETITDQFVAPHRLGALPTWGQRDRLQLSRWPLVLPTTVSGAVVNPIAVSLTSCDGTVEALTLGPDFLANAALGQLTRLRTDGSAGWWPSGGISVSYAAGYAAVPFDIADAVTRLVKSRYASRTRDPLLRSETIPGVSASAWWVATGDGGNLPPDVADALDQYRVPVIA